MGVIKRLGEGEKTLRGKKWENERSQESRISSKADKEEGRAGGKRLAVLNGNLHVCVCVSVHRCCCLRHVPSASISLFCCSKPPFSTDPFTHNSSPVDTHTHTHRGLVPFFPSILVHTTPLSLLSTPPPHLQACVSAFCG